MDEQNKKKSTIGGIIFTGCMFIGLGLGLHYGVVTTGLFIGMGTGFIAMGLVWAFLR